MLHLCLGVVFTTGFLGATETRKREVLVNLVKGAVELVRPESPAWSLAAQQGALLSVFIGASGNRGNRTKLKNKGGIIVNVSDIN